MSLDRLAPRDGIEKRVLFELDAIGADYELMECDPDLADTAMFCAAYGVELEDSANTIVLVAKGSTIRHVACAVLATTRLDVNHAVRSRLSAKKVSFASPEETQAITGMTVGGVTPFGLPEQFAVFVDPLVFSRRLIVLGGGSRRFKIRCAPALLERIDGVEIVPGLARQAGG